MRPPKPRSRGQTIAIVLFCFILCLAAMQSQIVEEDRVAEYHRRGYNWPPLDSEFVPPTPGWKKLLRRRLEQVDLLEMGGQDDVYNAYLTTLSSVLIHNYTKYGFGITKGHRNSLRLIQDFIQSSIGSLNETTVARLPIEVPDEIAINTIEEDDHKLGDGDEHALTNRPKFLTLPESIRMTVLEEIRPILEAWIGGIKLEPVSAYGLRIYQNTSQLYMHLDNRITHVISAIFHIGHDTVKPWPLVIEDFTGTTNEVHLNPGDMLLYESSKCWHGRPRRMEGTWYTSLFVHFRPVHAPTSPDLTFSEYIQDVDWTIHHRVPPHWPSRYETKANVNIQTLVTPETFAYEPDCDDGWCELKEALVMGGPAPNDYGKVLTGNGELEDLDLDIGDSKDEDEL
jgi:hypothetical protein